MAAEWYNTEGEWETVNEDGFIFKRRKRHLDADVAPLATKEAQQQENPKPAPKQALELEKKKQMLLATKAMYLAELEAWEKLAAAAAPPPSEEPLSSPDTSLSKCEPNPRADILKELKIEVENVEEYVKRVQDVIVLTETAYKVLVKDKLEDVNFRPAEDIVRALTAPSSADLEQLILTQASLGSSMSFSETD